MFESAFESAFVIDDDDDAASSTVPDKDGDGGADTTTPATQPEKENIAADKNGVDNGDQAKPETTQTNGNNVQPPQQASEPVQEQKTVPVTELPPEVRTKLKKFEKLEKAYGGMVSRTLYRRDLFY